MKGYNITNKERRDAGMLYITDEEILEEQARARRLTQKLNTMDRSDYEGLQQVVKELLGKSHDAWINPPFYCDYGTHIQVGKNFFANYNCTILDVGKVIIGDNCQMASNVAIYTAGHPIHPAARNTAFEYGIDVVIGDNVWIGGNTVICPGVHIGNHCVIGAGSVVTKDIPDWSIAAGNPCRVLRKITEEDRQYYFRKQKVDDVAWAQMQQIWKENQDEKTFPVAPEQDV
ncbi:MAG: sugar O-acetyltransferase [Lachnospiraceae bacterium]|nr:sugar O-acetyltransferase [Lachnospiraceae bacterium]